ncbi:hypothetical protein PsYK624_000720 [Phanerochaete sordida]|uniref:CcmS related domain-containing protein n=1 Tax=Phanerochaete sordida TaxID=48140 RepID=A0A9P3L7H3_9APHY|nr:hypothetical protein PsYK624_000720 [Phanerochaete sordida]
MPKKLKGKQKDPTRQQIPGAFPVPPPPPPPPGKLPTIPEQIQTLPKRNANVHALNGAASGSYPANTWEAAEGEPKYLAGAWGRQDEEEEGDEGEGEDEHGDGWGHHAREGDQWGGGSGTGAHATPAMGASPAAGWGQELPAQGGGGGGWGMANMANMANITSALTSAFGAAPAPAPGPYKGNMKKSPPTVPTPPASKRVAFEAASQMPPGAAPQALGRHTQQSPPQANGVMHAHSQSAPGFAGGWGAPEKPQLGFGGINQPPGAGFVQRQAHQQPARIQTNFPPAPVPPPSQSAPVKLPTGAWTTWGKEPQFGMPQVAATMMASVPTAPSHPQAQSPATAAATVVAPANAILQQAAQRDAQLHAMLDRANARNAMPGQFPPGMHQRHPPAPAAGEQSPAWPQQPKQSWDQWAKTRQEQGALRGQAKPQRPQQMQPSQSWGSQEWTDVGRDSARNGWGADEDGEDDGGWGNTAATGGGRGGGWGDPGGGGGGGGRGHANYEDDDAAWAQPKTSHRERGRSHDHHKPKHRDADGWSSTGGADWGGSHGAPGKGHKAREVNDWGQTNAGTGWPSPNGHAALGQPKLAHGAGKSPRAHPGWGAIPEEEEEEEDDYDEEDEDGDELEDEDYDDLDDMYLDPRQADRKRKTNSGISYQYQPPAERLAPGLMPGMMPPSAMAPARPPSAMTPSRPYGTLPPGAFPPGMMPPGMTSPGMLPAGFMPHGVAPAGTLPPGAAPLHASPAAPQLGTFASFGPIDPHAPTTPSREYSRTMNIATGRMASAFEVSPPKRGRVSDSNDSGSPIESHGEGLKPATPALFNSRKRFARERIYWGFNPDKDERVSSLLRWVQAMSHGIAVLGVQKFLETGQRGALFANADFQVSTPDGGPKQPAFDWLTLQQIRPTMDRILQESVVCYKPMFQVIVFVFLLSKSGSSMAVWRRKIPVPESVRVPNHRDLEDVILDLPEEKVVYVDEAPPELDEPPPPPPPKKRGFWRRLFGIFRRKRKDKAQ